MYDMNEPDLTLPNVAPLILPLALGVKSVLSAGGTDFFSRAVSLVSLIASGLAVRLLTVPGV